MSDASITVGADLSELNRDLINAAKATEQGGHAMAKGLEHGAAAHDHLFKSQRRVEKSAVSLTGQLLSAGSTMDVVAASAEALEKALHLPLGTAIGIGAAALAYDKLHESLMKVKEANETGETARQNTNQAISLGSGPEELKKAAEENEKALEEVRKSRTFGAAAANFYVGSKQMEKSFEIENELLEAQVKINEKIGQQARERSEIAEVTLNKSEREGAILKLKAETEERIAKIRADKSLNPEGINALTKEAHADEERGLQQINDKADAKQNEIDLENRILYIKQRGLDVDQLSAKARLEAAEDTLKAAHTDEAKAEASAKVDAAQQEYDQAKKTTQEKRAQVKIETDIANFVGAADDKRRLQLQKEREELERRRALAKPDELDGIDRDLAKNAESGRDLNQSVFQKQLAGSRARSGAATGRGADEQIAAARREMVALNLELDEAKRTYGDTSVEADQINAKIVDQKRHIDDITFAAAQQLLAAKATTVEMDLQLKGETLAVAQAKIRSQFEAQIAAAQRDQNTQLAAQLQKQQQIAQRALAIQQYNKPQDQRNADNAAKKKAESDAKKYDAQRASIERDMANGVTDFGNGRRGEIAAQIIEERKKKSLGEAAGENTPAVPGQGVTKPPGGGKPGITGAKDSAMQITQMTVETMTVNKMTVITIASE